MLGINLTIVRRSPVGGVVYEAETLDWRDRVVANGGLAPAPALNAMNNFVVYNQDNSLWAKINRINLFAGTLLAAAAVPLKVGTGAALDTMVNFLEADYAQATGLTANGTSKYINTGLGLNVPATGGIGFYLRNTMVNVGTKRLMGLSDGTDQITIEQRSTPAKTGVWLGTAGTPVVGSQMVPGFQHIDRSAANKLDYYENGVLISTRTTVTAAGLGGALNLFVFAHNLSGAANTFSDAIGGGYWHTSTMTGPDILLFRTGIEAFQDEFGRGVA